MRHARVACAGALVIGGLGGIGCRTAGGALSATPGAAGVVQALTGERRILRFDGRRTSLSFKVQDPAPPSGPCDVVVEIRSAGFGNGAARFSLAPIGQARLESPPPGPVAEKAPCRELPAATGLVLSGLKGATPEKVASSVGKVLLTEDDYLLARGLHFDRPPGPDDTEVADRELTGSLDEQKLARAITAPERRLVAFDPVYRGLTRKPYYEAEVEFVAVVGVDGRLHGPRMKTPLGEHQERVLRLLSLWRYEPARRGDTPVAVRVVEKAILRIY